MSDLEAMAGNTPDDNPRIDGERRQKLFNLAKKLHKGWRIEVAYQDDEWLVIGSFLLAGTPYEVVHRLDENTSAEHAELFKGALADTLEEYQKKHKIIMPAGTIH